MLLDIQSLQVRYAGIEAVRGVSLHVAEGSIVTLIGSNGAGKSSILRAISGLVDRAVGTISFKGQETTRMPAFQIARLGIGHVPEGRQVFATMTVRENLRLGAYMEKNSQLVQERMGEVFTRFPQLQKRQGQLAGTLSGGEQQMLAIGRALMINPILLLMDEPSLGLAPIIVEEIGHIISSLRKSGLTIVLVEQNATLALELSDYAIVLENGSIALEGASKQLKGDIQVVSAYLGA